ncbi:ABC transporter permease [Ktedonosporobacter rubrisoli]|uniref:ABC transporter permease n=1 Tax=Ktedonosporobacter rubrisoli TaxID=2509675 RepID=A0A4P6JRG2_KTERU|nr:ABC transporter permease [Ktedonosporobacter rubrisoli]QBD78049.1 ABC transporter permease [Ktedonosporobacter rubrisoli]
MRRFIQAIRGFWSASHKVQIGIVILAFFILVALFHPLINSAIGHGSDPLAVSASEAWELPNAQHLLGTDRYGRDILAMTVTATVASLEVGTIAGLLSTIIGVVVAFVAGYKGGKLDSFLSGFTDIILVVPSFPLLITLSAYTTKVSLFFIALMLAIFSWPFAARTIRSQVLSLRNRPYVELAKVTKLNDFEIIFMELLPNLLPFIGVGFASAALGSIFALVGLEVIGLGPSGTLDLGLMLNWAQSWGALTLGCWPLFVAPVVVLTLLFLAVNLINIGLEEVYNPRLRKMAGA